MFLQINKTIMKKEYILPTASVIYIRTDQIMQIPTSLPNNPNGEPVSVGLTETEYNGEGASRKSIWEDDDNDF